MLERKALEAERDARRRSDLERRLDDMRQQRELENRRIDAIRAEAEERKRERIATQRLHSGSRFNLRYDGGVPRGITPDQVMDVLEPFVNFSSVSRNEGRLGDELHPGMGIDDAKRALGPAFHTAERQEGESTTVTLVFARRYERIAAEFVDGALVRVVRLDEFR